MTKKRKVPHYCTRYCDRCYSGPSSDSVVIPGEWMRQVAPEVYMVAATKLCRIDFIHDPEGTCDGCRNTRYMKYLRLMKLIFALVPKLKERVR